MNKSNTSIPTVSIVIPLYNESEVFSELVNRLSSLIDSSDIEIEVVLVDDGSKDGTDMLMRQLSLSHPNFTSVFLSRNFGHQIALTAGLKYATASEAIFILDGDLQDPPELIFDFFAKIKEGYDVVYAIRKSRKESLFKRIAYKQYYKIMKSIAYIDIPIDAGDFGMISRRVLNILNSMPEESRYLRGMRSWVGFKQIGIEYDRSSRFSGESKYSINELIKLSMNGIFNFSEFPIKLLINVGIGSILFSLLFLFYTLYSKFFIGTVPSGYASLLAIIVLFGGIQLMALGLLGQYILRIFFQVKGRPLFIVSDVVKIDK